MSSSTSNSNWAPRTQDERRRLFLYFAVLALFAVGALPTSDAVRERLGLWFLESVGELLPVPSIVERQLNERALYGSAIFDDDFSYKLELIRYRQPTVLALGSSRALQFREEFFSVPFANAGRGMNAVEEGQRFVDQLLSFHQPDVVLLTIDLWWLNPNRVFRGVSPRDLEDTSGPVSQFWSYVNDRKVSMTQVFRALFGNDRNPISLAPSIGIAAYTRGRGYRPDGSRDYGDRYFGLDPTFDDVGFANSLHRARQGVTLLSHGASIEEMRVNDLARLIRRLQKEGVHVVAILPPFAQAVLDEIEQQGDAFAYIEAAREKLVVLPARVFDFTDPASVGASDCEFADGLHGGDVIYQRMLQHIAERDPLIAGLVRGDLLAANVERFKGRALTITDNFQYRLYEVDFLKIGCRKQPGFDLWSQPERAAARVSD